MIRLIVAVCAALALLVDSATAQWQLPNHSIPLGRGAGVTGFSALGPGSIRGLPLVSGNASQDPSIGGATVFDATAYGVKCDGATNDVAAINAAITAASTAGGGIVQLQASTSACIVGGAQIILPSNVQLRGVSRDATTLKLLAQYDDWVIQSSNTATNAGVSDLTMDMGDFKSTGYAGAIIFGNSVTSPYVVRIRITKKGRAGIAFQGATNALVADNLCEQTTADGSYQNECLDFTAAYRNYNGVITRNRFINSAMSVAGNGMIITDNTVYGFKFGSGITLSQDLYSQNAVVIGNTAGGSSGVDANGWKPAGIENWIPFSTIVGNILDTNSSHGIYNGAQYVTITGNVTIDNNTSGDTNGAGIFSQFSGTGTTAYNGDGSYSIITGNVSMNRTGAAGTQKWGYYENTSIVGVHLSDNVLATNATGDVGGNTSKIVFNKYGGYGTSAMILAQSPTADIGIFANNTGTNGRNWGLISSSTGSGLTAGAMCLYDATTGGVGGARLCIDSTGKTMVTANIASTTYTTGSLVVTGGLGLSGDLYSNGGLAAKSATISTNVVGAAKVFVQNSNTGQYSEAGFAIGIPLSSMGSQGGTNIVHTILDASQTQGIFQINQATYVGANVQPILQFDYNAQQWKFYTSNNLKLTIENTNGQVAAESTYAATSTTTGALRSKGGLGVAGAGYFGTQIVTSTYVQTGAVAVGSLPTCNAAAKGARYFVTDANATTFATTVAAGGANNVPVVCNGANWIIG